MALAGLTPFTDQFGLLLKIGFYGVQTQLTTLSAGAPPSLHGSDLNSFGGMGVQYDFSKSLGARVEVECYNAAASAVPTSI